MAIAMTSPERRKAPRITVERIAYLNFEGRNGGIILNVAEGGLCFHSIVPLQRGETVQFWLQERGERIEAEGRVAWMDDSQKRGGLCFTEIAAEAREKLWDLIWEPRTGGPEPIPAGMWGTGKKQNPRVVRVRVPSTQALRQRLFSTFSAGLASGLVISALITAAFFSRHQIGEVLIRMGERLAAKPAAPPKPLPQPRSEEAAQMQEQVVSPRPQNGEAKTPTASTLRSTAQPEDLLIVPRPSMPAMSQPKSVVPGPPLDTTLTRAGSPSQAPTLAGAGTTFSNAQTGALPEALNTPPTGAVPEHADKPTPLPPPTATIVHTETSRSVGDGLREQMYFEVGKFKQQLWAKEQTDKLAKLGFPATILQKGHLWMNSYHVLVGPYSETAEAEAAHRNLLSQGFMARPFERGSRNFVLPTRLVLHGRQVPAGDCLISWESYLSDVKVKFEQDDNAVATAEAQWVSRDPRYQRSATVYLQNRDGSRALVELRFEGMTRALVFR